MANARFELGAIAGRVIHVTSKSLSGSEKISFNQLNRATGHRIKYVKVSADTDEEVANEDIVKGYQLDTDVFVEMSKEELRTRAG
jgi:DNA end-binding protein Ku